MKLVLTILFNLIILNFNFAQGKLLDILPLKNGKVTYSAVVEVDSVSKDELYNRVKRWFVNTYNSGKDVIQLDDKENGEAIGKGFFEETWMVTFYAAQNVKVWQTVKIQLKENKYRYEITDFRMKYYVAPSAYTKGTDIDIALEEWNKDRDSNNKKFYPKIDSRVKAIILSLEKAMKTANDDNW